MGGYKIVAAFILATACFCDALSAKICSVVVEDIPCSTFYTDDLCESDDNCDISPIDGKMVCFREDPGVFAYDQNVHGYTAAQPNETGFLFFTHTESFKCAVQADCARECNTFIIGGQVISCQVSTYLAA